MRKINMGILPCSDISIKHIIPALQLNPNFNISGITSRDSVKGGIVSRDYNTQYFSYSDLIKSENIDAIYISLPTGLHYEWIKKGLLNGKHILCEKSLTTSYSDTLDLVNLAKKNNLVLVENFQFQHHKRNIAVKQIIDNKDYGEIKSIHSSFSFPHLDEKTNFRYSLKLGGGSLLDVGAYTTKVTTFLLGNDVSVIGAYLNYCPTLQIDLNGNLLMSNNCGIGATSNFGFGMRYQCQYEIIFEKAKIIVPRAFTCPPDIESLILIEEESGSSHIHFGPDNHFNNMLSYFYRLICDGDIETESEKNLKQSKMLFDVLKVKK